jgi:hypothetical protein
MLLLLGVLIGVLGVAYVQENHLPPRLTAQASTELRDTLERTEAERARLQSELGATSQQLQAALSEKQGLTADQASARKSVQQLQEEVASLLAALPPDPRGGPVEVRIARFAMQDGALAYDVVLTRERAGTTPLVGTMQFVADGTTARGTEQTLDLDAVPISLGAYQILRGTVPLPTGFSPRRATVQVMDRAGSRLGMRVMFVR